ncbi:hypothetical protein M5K25_001395 [Dendrobium thyrsiflorum]|uniref:Transmembrane protein n=1 Tax=Dendrobium thyrsiflorum TaxID=117978 RepID=A0ABD0VZ96_DENTH
MAVFPSLVALGFSPSWFFFQWLVRSPCGYLFWFPSLFVPVPLVVRPGSPSCPSRFPWLFVPSPLVALASSLCGFSGVVWPWPFGLLSPCFLVGSAKGGRVVWLPLFGDVWAASSHLYI